MDQKLLTFLTLCRTMNYRRAADALHLTPAPPVTKQIQSLESQYGVKLFSYDERKLRKTVQGEILERYAMELQYNDAELARLLAAKPKTLLRIGATKSIGDYILIPEIQRFLESPENELFSRSTTPRTFFLIWRPESWTLSCSRAFSTSGGTTTFCCAKSPISASARRITRGADGASTLKRFSPSASFCESPARAHEISWSASLPSRANTVRGVERRVCTAAQNYPRACCIRLRRELFI